MRTSLQIGKIEDDDEFLSKSIRYVMEISFSNFWQKKRGKNIAGMVSRDLEKCGSRPPHCPITEYNKIIQQNFQKIDFHRYDFCKNCHDCSF